jgi:signal transduction histidine kinase/ligand-binding sensor domain-containing protein
VRRRALIAGLLGLWCAGSAIALNPRKSLTQYSRKVWTQEQGLPQDTVRAIAQTTDGYLWLGTDEGLARFDGFEFVVFSKANSGLPSNSIAALAASPDGSLWIGTAAGLTQYHDHQFRTFTTKQGMPDDAVTELYEDQGGTLWVVAGVSLSRFEHGKFTNFAPGADLPLTAVRHVVEDRHHDLWLAGFGAVVRMSGGKVSPEIHAETLQNNILNALLLDREGNLWMGGSTGLIERTGAGEIRRYDAQQGLPDGFVRALWEDRDGNLWVGTSGGLARLDGTRFVAVPDDGAGDLVRCVFEDREGNLWVGSNSGLIRFRDDVFTSYGRPEGLPGDEPNTVFQDREGRVWVGFHDNGLMLLTGGSRRVYTTRDGLPTDEIFSIRQTRSGDLLIAARGGMTRMHDGKFSVFRPRDPLGRLNVFDAMEDASGRTWLATPGGLGELVGTEFRIVVPGEPVLAGSVVTLCEGRGGTIWAGTYGRGLWRVQNGQTKQFTTADGLSNDQIRSLHLDADGTLWVGTFGGGLDALRDGKFTQYTEKDGLLSDNIADISDDGESLWLSTTRGICRVPRQQLKDYAEGRRHVLEPVNYGMEDGLRSAQCSPSSIGAGGRMTRDGRLWFITNRGLSVFDPSARLPKPLAPEVHIGEVSVDDRPIDLHTAANLNPGSGRVQFRYTGIHLAAPERVRYWYRLDGLDHDWIRGGTRRVVNYNSLHHGRYTFRIRADILGGPSAEASYAFAVLPWFYETTWFRALALALLAGSVWLFYRLQLRQVRLRFAAVLEERARLAREIHDTLAQGFVGISSQLDAVAMCMPNDASPARNILDLARRMARHSLTEARRSVMDLRSSALENQDLAAAIETGTRQWTAGSGVNVDVDVSGSRMLLPEQVEQHLLRIAQEAVANILKHAQAKHIWIKLHMEARKLYLQIKDDGRGFEQDGVFSSLAGHFGILGMRERAERLGGELRLASHPGEGTEVDVSVPLP